MGLLYLQVQPVEVNIFLLWHIQLERKDSK